MLFPILNRQEELHVFLHPFCGLCWSISAERLQFRTSDVPLTVLRLEIGSITETAKRTIFYFLSIRNLERYLVNLASGFCFSCVFCEPRYVAAEMILYMRFCEMESEHASRGHHNSSVYDLFYFIIFFFLILEFVWTEKSWVYVPSVFLNIGDSSAKLCLH